MSGGLAATTWAVLLIAGTSSVRAADSLLNWDGHEPVRIYHAYSASDGKSYIEQIDMPLQLGGYGSRQLFNFENVLSVHVGTSQPHELSDWHYANNRHLIIPLQGNLRFDTGDGKEYLLRPGEAVLAEDWTGKGHRSGCDSRNKVACVAVDVTIGPINKVLPLRDPPR
jgi:hypothetical protein